MSDIEQTARDMGWRPQEEFRGEASKWVDAQTFVSRGENFLPILRADNKRLKDQVDAQAASLAETNRLLAASQEAIAELKEFHTADTARQVKDAKAGIIAQLKEVRDAGDVESEVRLQDELTDLRAAERAAAEKKPAAAPAAAPAPAAPPAEDPVFTAWKAANPWLAEKPRLRALAMGIAEEVRSANPTLFGKPFFDKIDDEMKQYLDGPAPTSKVTGGRPSGGGGGGGTPRTRAFADLPAEAKEACDRQAKKLVGAGRAFKTVDEQRAHYVSHYFAGESA